MGQGDLVAFTVGPAQAGYTPVYIIPQNWPNFNWENPDFSYVRVRKGIMQYQEKDEWG
jgi:hypothetical protein